ncbi:MAG: hypothetical protein A2644_02275 [Candidatus Zambryskibacteria bacterium RIFCSPHIGHO2_01_FULL_39_63]|nr:MAG: hypothetical protein A2644_02275 [Candidatus Zambryskibacteria bacterium RIFCSPHIGHO2_01_FULL_39_63]OHA94832.1 MAG: hypothetical protein A3B88_04320 [Candidatus Zambryskibacteria bacterium RIFCSPHIGHO2_02_FULL_39_19]OHA98322.1 MAG: hypothetical protein A3F20_02010 [Candidatus Zambryskibacteria bacterium RIFCSPHIGHO2_12_FULL_39_21]
MSKSDILGVVCKKTQDRKKLPFRALSRKNQKGHDHTGSLVLFRGSQEFQPPDHGLFYLYNLHKI